MSYLLDANVFIQAKNLHHGLDFCPAFWQWLLDNHNESLELAQLRAPLFPKPISGELHIADAEGILEMRL